MKIKTSYDLLDRLFQNYLLNNNSVYVGELAKFKESSIDILSGPKPPEKNNITY